ncbi:MAG TPA: TonB-dependent receptor [Candidatus Sulfotelmatobacter sp.]|nr:TonB-dependent receptor [Candidatus Sulfotelmatobacter sp.]
MRVFSGFLFSLLLAVSAFAADLTVKVVDPHSAVVSGAQVTLTHPNDSKVLATQTTSAEGVVTLHVQESGAYQIKVLAPGFAAENVEVSKQTEVTIRLHLATASETVVVSATRTPVPGEAAGADVDTLNQQQLATMQPIASDDAIRFLPGAVVNTAGQRGGLSSLFVRGGESNYNKVIVDGVTVNEPGGTFDFGTLSLAQGDRMEFVRGAQSTLYGSDAMTSVVQVWTRTGSTPIPEIRFGADGGNFGSAHGFASVAGARDRLDYNLFGDQFNSNGFGSNDTYSDSLEGANVGAKLNDEASLRVRLRHSNSHTGLPGEWNFNGYVPLVPANGPSAPLVPLQPNPDDWSQLNSLLGSVELAVAAPNGWQHHFTAFDYLYRYYDLNPGDPLRVDPYGDPIDYPSNEVDHINRGGFEYQGDYSERSWEHTTFGYRLENENGFVGDLDYGAQNHGQRLNQDTYLQQMLNLGRLNVIAGGRFVHDSAFGNTGVPRVALTYQILRGNEKLSGTRLRFSYSTGFKEPRLEESFNGLPGPDPYNIPNPGLKPERVRAFEAGFQQDFLAHKFEFTGTYFNNLFHDQINYVTMNTPPNFPGQYVNVNQAFAQGAEAVLRAKLSSHLLLNSAYTYTSSEYLDNPAPYDAVYNPGQPLLRRPKHSATTMLSYLGNRWAANLSGSYVGTRADSDFDNFNINHAAGYVRVDLGGSYNVNSHVATYLDISNALDRRYNEVVGYPALPINFRAGLRFQFGGGK